MAGRHGLYDPDDVQQQWLQGREKFFFTDFYIQQRKRLGCLLDGNGKPAGGKWTFDTENRKKLPKGTRVPKLWKPGERDSVGEARRYVHQHFPNAVGDDAGFWFPVTHQDARRWLKNFLDHRFEDFGIYEDAIAAEETTLFHSVLTPMLNIGLITPAEVIESALSKIDDVPMNSLEGFIRQVIGWREFVRMIYLHQGRRQRTHNFWGFKRSLPKSFYDGTTGIDPLDQVIRRVLKHAYSHHIERLMVLGNFMLLCEINPHHVYRWFMELYVDAYDWVMVPNVYGMSQFADGGLMTTKPYISGSSYVLRMSDFKKGDWCPVWDALYWRFIHNHREFFAGNPRMSVMVKQLDKMGDKLKTHLTNADRFLNRL